MSVQIRPTQNAGGGANDAPFYSPDRDLAYGFPAIVSNAIVGLRDAREPWIDDYLKAKGIGHKEVGIAAEAYVRSFQMMVGDPTITSPQMALGAAGFFTSDPAAQLVVAAKIGQVFTGVSFTALREVSPMAGPSPLQADLNRLVTAGVLTAKAMSRPAWVRRVRRWFRLDA
jgi:hypothetical protein